MSDQTIITIFDILLELLYIAVFLAAIVVAYLTLQRPKVKQWLKPAGALVRIAAFVALTVLLYWPPSYIVGDLFAFPDAVINGSQAYYPSVRCFGGLVTLIAMTVGIVLLARGASQRGAEEQQVQDESSENS